MCEHLHVSNMWLYTLEIGEAQPDAPSQKSRRHNRFFFFFCVNRSLIRYGFLGGAQAIRYTVNTALTFIHFPDN